MFEQPFIIPSCIFILIAIPLILGIVPRNKIYGIRTPKTLSDDIIWFRANRFAGIYILISGIVYIIVAIILPYDKSVVDNFSIWLIHFCAFVFPLVIILLLTLKYIKSL